MHSQQKNPEDYLSDERFIEWAKIAINSVNIDYSQFDGHENATIVSQSINLFKLLQTKQKEVSPTIIETEKLKLIQSLKNQPNKKIVGYLSFKYWAAAAILFLLISGTIWLKNYNNITHTTKYGSTLAETLPDGSTIKLNSHSSISYAKNFDHKQLREVWVNGEAFFHVQKTPKKTKFIVHLSKFDIEVLGTKFNVENFNGGSKVLLSEGSIKLIGKNGIVIMMKPGELVAVEPEQELTANSTIVEGKETTILSWLENKITLEQTTLKETAKIIHNLYGYDVIIKDEKLLQNKISGILPSNNIDVFLKALEATNDFVIKTKNNTITIEANH